jgi:hypothetical protein
MHATADTRVVINSSGSGRRVMRSVRRYLAVRCDMKNLTLILCLFVISLSVDTRATSPGRCLPMRSVEDEFNGSDAVFSGRVLEVSKVKIENCMWSDCVRHKVRVKVDQSWKGVKAKEVVFYVGIGGSEAGINGGLMMSLKPGDKWLIYAVGKEELYTSGCSRARRLAEAKEDLKRLRQLKRATRAL